MAKKKKSQLKPVVRGFATTSVPKKVVLATTSETEDQDDAPDLHALPLDVPEAQPDGGASEQVSAEEQLLQSLVERLQERTEKEITRTIKAIEYDRRFAKSFSPVALDSTLCDRILSLITEEPDDAPKPLLDDSEEKLLAKLAVTYGVLRRLGFSESRVEECLVATPGVDVEDALHWLYLHCAEDELITDKGALVSEATSPLLTETTVTYEMNDIKTPRTPRTPAPFHPGHDAVRVMPLHFKSASYEDPENAELSTPEVSSSPSLRVASLECEEEVEDPNARYAKLKVHIHELEERQMRSTSDTILLKDLRARLDEVKTHYFFREKVAEELFRTEKASADLALLTRRLRGVDKDNHANGQTPKVKRRPPNLNSHPDSTSPNISIDLFEEGSDSESRSQTALGILGNILDEMPKEEVTSNGVLISVRDMSLPKHWAGRIPKVILSETVSKVDRYAAITYHDVGGESRARRAGVTIRWEGGKTGVWEMIETGCHDMAQAENFVATCALHAVTFIESEGFAGGGAASHATYFRLLPPAFRDLWDELEAKRKTADTLHNRTVWAKLKTIVELKLRAGGKTMSKGQKSPAPTQDNVSTRPIGPSHEFLPEHIQAGFAARQATAEYQDMLIQRNHLPIAHYRQRILSELQESQVLVLSGETGCGKSTQVPAFILEDQLSQGKHCKIYCTEPRRISAISLAQRVSRELGEPPNVVGTMASLVGYSIRLESNTCRNTRLAFVTNGIALRMLEGGSGTGGTGTAFDEITHIVIDEVHERTIESDFLLIVLKSMLEHRKDLKVVLMSATLDAEKISSFFGGCPVLHVPGRTFPVDIRFLEDAIELSHWTVKEGSAYAKRSNDKFHRSKSKADWNEDMAVIDDDDELPAAEVHLEKRYLPSTLETINRLDERLIPFELIVRLLECICYERQDYVAYSPAILVFMPGLGEIRRLNDVLMEHRAFGDTSLFKIYPLHSTLSSENQGAVFDIPPPGIRKIVIATNIAETGITIPDITCVIDAGKHREMRFDEKRQISRLIDTFIARSNAAQRRGRAGRVRSGLCFHLFTKARHDTLMAENPLPEMLRLSLSDLALRIKILNVKLGDSIEDVLLRAMDPPSQTNIQRAISSLVEVKALTPSEEITPMGRLLSKLPTDVHLGKFLLVSALFGCLDPALTIAATLNSKSPFITPLGLEQEADRAKLAFKLENSDFLTLHNAFGSWRKACANTGFARKFCRTNFLSHQNLQQIEELRQQFLGYLIDSGFMRVDRAYIKELNRARYGRHRTRFVTVPAEFDRNSSDHSLLTAALTAGLYPRILSIDPVTGQLRTITNNQVVAFHPSSVNFGRKPRDFAVNHLCYFTIMHSKKLYAWETGAVDDIALLLLCGESDFKFHADSISIDRKIRFRISSKSNLALKHLREQMSSILAAQMRGKALTETQQRWFELGMLVLSRRKAAIQDHEYVHL